MKIVMWEIIDEKGNRLACFKKRGTLEKVFRVVSARVKAGQTENLPSYVVRHTMEYPSGFDLYKHLTRKGGRSDEAIKESFKKFEIREDLSGVSSVRRRNLAPFNWSLIK